MPYASQQDIVDRHGQDALLLVADRDGDGAVDATAVDQALADATAEVDAYLGSRYALPLPSVPHTLVRVAVDIALYRLTPTADVATEERRKRYEDAVSLLKRLASGEVRLGLPEAPPSSNGTVYSTGHERRFTRRSMRRLT